MPRPHLPWDQVYPTLDLHGETAESALRIADRWLRVQRAEGARTVRVITGRGAHSKGPPVLRVEIAALLDRLRGRVVAGVQTESGGGAFRIELRRAPRSPRAPRSAAPVRPAPWEADPELRRRAEESLAELGVTPTEALLQAEMRRLRGEQG